MNPGIHLFHKPVGPTSFSLVQTCMDQARSTPGPAPRLCHGGTLDPFAQGLLLILVGSATRLFDHLHSIPKTYVANVRWGVETDNGDLLGTPVSTADASRLSPALLDETLGGFIGWHDQIPPATSNKRIDGERAYAKAHRGEAVVLPPSRVYLHHAHWLSHDLPHQSTLEISVRGGYYVRSLARDLGRRLGCGAHLSALNRTAIGPWSDPGPKGQAVHVTGRSLLPWTSSRILSDQDVGDLRQSKSIAAGTLLRPEWSLPPEFTDPRAPIRGFHQNRLAFLLRQEAGRLEAATMLKGL